jgi:hypothetical protein
LIGIKQRGELALQTERPSERHIRSYARGQRTVLGSARRVVGNAGPCGQIAQLYQTAPAR